MKMYCLITSKFWIIEIGLRMITLKWIGRLINLVISKTANISTMFLENTLLFYSPIVYFYGCFLHVIAHFFTSLEQEQKQEPFHGCFS